TVGVLTIWRFYQRRWTMRNVKNRQRAAERFYLDANGKRQDKKFWDAMLGTEPNPTYRTSTGRTSSTRSARCAGCIPRFQAMTAVINTSETVAMEQPHGPHTVTTGVLRARQYERLAPEVRAALDASSRDLPRRYPPEWFVGRR